MAYTPPTADDLKARYPAFVDVPDATVDYWLTDATRIVGTPEGTDWIEGDAPIGVMLLAAHNMALNGILVANSSSDLAMPAGVTSLRSGNLSITRTAEAANEGSDTGFAATNYGRQFLALLQANRGGIRVTGTGHVDFGCGGRYLSGLHPSC